MSTDQIDWDDGIEWSQGEWATWIHDCLEKRARVYSITPAYLISDYRQETNCRNEYRGRELLELVQNADDGGADADQGNSVVIALTREGLCVANTGRTFSALGIQSLMISHTSPKHHACTRYIGNKGLGFRSILNWTSSPFILSGDLAIGFDEEHATAWLNRLCDTEHSVRAIVEKETVDGDNTQPVAKLAVPILLDHHCADVRNILRTATFPSVWACAKGLKQDGYDTIIAAPFRDGIRDGKAYDQAMAQLESIGRNALLFTNNLKRLIIRTPKGERIWSVERDEDQLIVTLDGYTPELFQLVEDQGTIPVEFLRRDQRSETKYDVKVAIPRGDGHLPHVLYNYFPTRVLFPYPLIAHVTMELTTNRQDVIESDANGYLAGQLANCMVEAAETCADDARPWRPLSLITPTGSLGLGLSQIGFQAYLVTAAKTHALVPLRSGELVRASEAKRLGVDPGTWLPRENFEDIALWPADPSLNATLDTLDVRIVQKDDLRCRLNSASSTLSSRERVALIVRLVISGIMPTGPSPDLLVDEYGTIIPADRIVFLPPSEGASLQLPHWMKLTILSNDLVASLRAGFKTPTARELAARLRSFFKVREFSLDSLTTAINASAEEQIEKDSTCAYQYRIDALQAIYTLYKRSGEGEGARTSGQDLKVLVPTRTGKILPGTELYFGAEYLMFRLCEGTRMQPPTAKGAGQNREGCECAPS